MASWRSVLKKVATRLALHPFWADYLAGLPESRRGLHLIALGEPAFSEVLFGVRDFEMQHLRSDRPPFESIGRGDVILVKRRGGPISGVVRVRRAWMFTGLTPDDWSRLSSALSSRPASGVVGNGFNPDNRTRFALVKLANTVTLPVPVEYRNGHKSGWSVLKPPRSPIGSRRYVSPTDIRALNGRRAARQSKAEEQGVHT